jgi:hypothetical protein
MDLTKDALEGLKYSSLVLNRLKFLIERKKYERARKIYEHIYINGCPALAFEISGISDVFARYDNINSGFFVLCALSTVVSNVEIIP